jgi:bacterioferritin (cytochrome b1)
VAFSIFSCKSTSVVVVVGTVIIEPYFEINDDNAVQVDALSYENAGSQDRLKLTIRALGGEPLIENGRLPVPEPPPSLKGMIERGSTPNEREVWESMNDLIIERAEVILYEGGIQALELLKADKRAIKVLEKNLKEEEAFAMWLEKNNPRIAKRLMKKQLEDRKKKLLTEETAVSA